MKMLFFILVFILMIVESCLYQNYPYNAIILAFLGYQANKNIVKALWWSVLALLIIGFNNENILFILFYLIIIYYIYKHMAYKQMNLIFISLLEAIIYIVYIYMFKIREILFLIWLKELFFLFLYNNVFYYYENKILDR
ncbi:MAG: hypothetical protein B6I28_02610 [Fusobacteriia bacterium 4572_132]|nr:MAG: hypothetical protein B6I28_02610 [Fusobacteriia bacterium 4572_132]